MKVTPKNVFILENGKYKEITYNELQQLEQTEKSYTSKRFLPLHGMLIADCFRRKENGRKGSGVTLMNIRIKKSDAGKSKISAETIIIFVLLVLYMIALALPLFWSVIVSFKIQYNPQQLCKIPFPNDTFFCIILRVLTMRRKIP